MTEENIILKAEEGLTIDIDILKEAIRKKMKEGNLFVGASIARKGKDMEEQVFFCVRGDGKVTIMNIEEGGESVFFSKEGDVITFP